jgi:RNA polymerase sigma factor (sigma-70 family)
MKKVYWVKKNPNSAAGWVEMDGKQFYEFIKSPAGKGRYFMDYGTFELEVTHEQYRQWKQEVNHRGYLQRFEDKAEIFSLEAVVENSELYGERSDEILTDYSTNTEDEVFHAIDMELLTKALDSLTYGERRLIDDLFLRDKPKTEDEIAALSGITRQAVNKQKNKILKKLRKAVAENEKSQQ